MQRGRQMSALRQRRPHRRELQLCDKPGLVRLLEQHVGSKVQRRKPGERLQLLGQRLAQHHHQRDVALVQRPPDARDRPLPHQLTGRLGENGPGVQVLVIDCQSPRVRNIARIPNDETRSQERAAAADTCGMADPSQAHLTADGDTARHVRMLTTLLAGCDPCGWVEAGGSPNLYAGLALEVVGALHRDAGVPAVVMMLPGEAALEPTTKFARVAVDWWRTTRDLRNPLPAVTRKTA